MKLKTVRLKDAFIVSGLAGGSTRTLSIDHGSFESLELLGAGHSIQVTLKDGRVYLFSWAGAVEWVEPISEQKKPENK